MQGVTFLTSREDVTKQQSIVGILNWLAQTTDPSAAPYVSIFGKYNAQPVESCKRVWKSILRYLKGQIGKCLCAQPGNKEGFKCYSDTDHAGLWAIDGDPRSRVGVVVTYNGIIYKSTQSQ